MSVATKLKKYLEDNSVGYSVISHSRTYTAQGTAEATHVPGNELAKTVVVRTDDRYVLVVLPAPRKVDVERLKAVLGARNLHMALESEFTSLFPGCEVGAMPPFGNLFGLDVYVEESLSRDEEIVFNACSHTDAIRMKYQDFLRLVNPKVAAFAMNA